MSDIVKSLERLQIITYLHVSSTGLLIYDYLLTFADEVRLVWDAPWNLGKALFFLTRYPAFVDTSLTLYHQVGYSLSVAKCIMLFKMTGWMFIVGIIIAEIILVIRVWALWHRSRKIGIFLTTVSVASIVVCGVAFAKFHTSQTFVAMNSISPSIPGCFPDGGSNIVFIDFAVLMAYETLILVMTLIKGIQHFRHGTSSFIYTFFQDGIMYYAFLLAISVINVIVLLTEPREYTNLLTSLQRSLHSMLSARILLHLRQDTVNSNSVVDGTATGEPIGSLVFAHTIPERSKNASGRHVSSRQWVDDGTWFGNGSFGQRSGVHGELDNLNVR